MMANVVNMNIDHSRTNQSFHRIHVWYIYLYTFTIQINQMYHSFHFWNDFNRRSYISMRRCEPTNVRWDHLGLGKCSRRLRFVGVSWCFRWCFRFRWCFQKKQTTNQRLGQQNYIKLLISLWPFSNFCWLIHRLQALFIWVLAAAALALLIYVPYAEYVTSFLNEAITQQILR